MTHEAEGMDVSQVVASSSATDHGHGVFVEAALLCCRIASRCSVLIVALRRL